MEDLWRIQNSAIDMKDLADLAEYHRFLDRFQHEEEGDHRRELLYGGANFGSEGQACGVASSQCWKAWIVGKIYASACW